MPRISDTVEAPFQGVSQAAASVRLPAQAEDLWNAMVAIPDGFTKRPPLDYLGVLVPAASLPTAQFQWTLIEDKDGETYFLVLDQLSFVRLVRLSTMTSIPITVTGTASTYLAAATDPVNDLRLVTVEDFTFVCNRRVPVALNPATSPTRPFESIVWLKLSDYSRKFTLDISGISGTYVAPEGNDPDDADDIDTSQIMDRLLNGGAVQLNGSMTPAGGIGAALTAAGFTWSLQGSLLFISRATDFTITVKDGLGGTALVALKGFTPRFSDLPLVAPDGFTIRVSGATGSTRDDYYVKFTSTGVASGGTTGTWRETIGPGAPLGIAATSLPIALVHNQTLNTWTLGTAAWTPREVGDLSSVPDPLPIGEPLKSIGWFKGRLRLLFSEGALYTGSDNPFRLYPSTLTTGLESDPIEITNPAEVRAFYKEAIAFDQRDVLFGSGSQAVVAQGSAQGGFSIQNLSVAELSRYPFDGIAPPLPASDNVHFGTIKSPGFTGVWELNVNGPLQRTQGEDLTAAIPRYLPTALVRGASIKDSYLSLRFQNESLKAYVHVYRYVGQDRIQSGFMPWGLPTGWRWGGVLAKQNMFYIALKDPLGNLVLTTLDTSAQLKDPDGGTILTTLDIRLKETQLTRTYNAGTDQTTISGPISLAGASFSARAGNAPETYPEGYLLSGPNVGATAVWQGNLTGVKLYAGFTYDSYWDLSQLYQRDPSTGKVRHEGSILTLKHLILDLKDTSLLGVLVTNGRRPSREYLYSQTAISAPNSFEGQWTVPIGGPAKEAAIRIQNNSHLQCGVLGFTWVGERNLKSQGA